MNLLVITTGYLPYAFSENICNGKLVLILKQLGHHVDVISRADDGPAYCSEWVSPWEELKDTAYEISYNVGSKWQRIFDSLKSGIRLRTIPMGGMRWGRHALAKALELHKNRAYDAVLSRSPSDIPHLVGRAFAKKTKVRWLANWNDPVVTIWPGCYAQDISSSYARIYNHAIADCLKTASINTFPSQRLLEHFKRFFPVLNHSHCKVAPHACLPKKLFPSGNYAPTPAFRICHCGNLSLERNPKLFFSAMKQVIAQTGVDIQLDIMGTQSPFVFSLAESCGVSAHVNFVGSFPFIPALEYMQNCDLLLLLEAQLDEGIFFASKITDYVQTGRPILAVSPHRGFASDIIKNYGGGISVDNENMSDIVKGLTIMVQSWMRNNLEKSYSTENLYNQFSAETIQNIYSELLA